MHAGCWLSETEVIGVGSFGCISKSMDGGKTWQVVRGAGRTTGVLYLMDKPEQIPWSLLASECLQQGNRSVLIWCDDDGETRQQDSLWPGKSTLIEFCAHNVGISDVIHLTNPPSLDEIGHCVWGWRPATIVLNQSAKESMSASLLQLAQVAGQNVVHRVAQVSNESTGVYQLDFAAAMPRSGRFAGEYQTEADQLFQRGGLREGQVYLRRLWDRSNLNRWNHLTASLPIADINAIRRTVPNGTGGTLGQLQARTQYPTMIARLLANAQTDPLRFEQQLAQVFRQLSEEDRAVLASGLFAAIEKQTIRTFGSKC